MCINIQYIIIRTNHTKLPSCQPYITPPNIVCSTSGNTITITTIGKKETNFCRMVFIEARNSYSGEEDKTPEHCGVVGDTAPVAAAEADVHCNMARAIQDMSAVHSHGWKVAGAAAAGTVRGVVRHTEAAAVGRHRMGGMAVSMQVLALVESIQALSLPHVEHCRESEHAEVVMHCSDQVVQKSSSAARCGLRMRS
jgi:hypothetical protein